METGEGGDCVSKPSAEQLSRAGDKYLGQSYDVMDCQRFVEKCLASIGVVKDLPGSNAWLREMTWWGSPEECRQKFGSVPVGAFLFILEQDGKEPAKYQGDGIGNASHIGIYTGRGDGAIHSSKSRGCVCTSAFKGKTIRGGWNVVGLWDALTYGETVDRILSGGAPPQKESGGDTAVEEWTDMEVYVADGTTVFLRASPSKSASYLVRVKSGTIVQAGADENGWRPVRHEGKAGWMMSKYLREPDTGPETVKVNKAELQRLYDTVGDWLGLRG